MIKIVGLGPGELKDMPIGVLETLKESNKIFLRTEHHPVVSDLRDMNIEFETFDYIYERFDSFEEVYNEIVTELINNEGDVCYGVPGHPLLAEATVQQLINRNNIEVEIIGGQSFLDVAFKALKIDPIEGFILIDALKFDMELINPNYHILIAQVYSQLVASNLKLDLMEKLDPEHPIIILENLGCENERLRCIKLYELDHNFDTSNLITIYIKKV